MPSVGKKKNPHKTEHADKKKIIAVIKKIKIPDSPPTISSDF